MDAIYLALLETYTPDTRDFIIHDALGLMGFKTPEYSIVRDTYGKPRLTVPNGSFIGYAQSHARGPQGTTSLVAMVKGRELGVDIEIWPMRNADPDFLETISCAQDKTALMTLGEAGRDLDQHGVDAIEAVRVV